jgi:hypothetical protein
MNMRRHHPAALPALAAVLAVVSALATSAAWGQVEREPNDPCPSAQNFGPITLPFSLNGNLDSSVNPDVDFFRVRGMPGSRVRIDLHSDDFDAYLGAFDSACNLLAEDDDSGGSLDSRLDMTYPSNGTLILAVTECCDGGFQGGGNGSYLLTVQESTSVTIAARLVDADTGLGIPGDYPVEGRANLELWSSASRLIARAGIT